MTDFHPVMNNTKWEELRLAMYAIKGGTTYRCMFITGHYSDPDGEWYYHFRQGGYDDIRYVDIFAKNQIHREQIRGALERIHLPGEETENGFRVYGYAVPGQVLDYL